ncbi:MAG TPA: AmmeMemoRadiSam system protein A [Bryobacterales bacterium]|jgi:AmmeMemoRadiSam system protein A|nr:AmmeMemoRadiSam system protein A [Bryobacterales bacterium]
MLPLTSVARNWLLVSARCAVEAAARGEIPAISQIPPEIPASDRPWLEQPHPVFVSLHLEGRLRGCVGHVGLEIPLRCLVPEMAYAAACEDTRFQPVTAEEALRIDIEIFILSPFFSIRPEEIIPGTHGLIVRQGQRRGILLPCVAAEHNWDAVRFLCETCRKAGLAPDAWKHGAVIEAFTAEVIKQAALAGASP